MTESQTKHFNIRRDRVPRFQAVMPRIRAHYPYQEAGLSWIVMDALEAFADRLDSNAASKAKLDAEEAALAEEDNHDG